MLLPIGTDRPMRHRPRACEALIAATGAAYVLVMLVGLGDATAAEQLVDALSLSGSEAASAPWTFLTYQFVHDSPFAGSDGSGLWKLLHLAFNMLGLWVFGRPLEDRLGHLGLAALYLSGGIVAGFAHVLDTPAPVIGASGAVCTMVGGFAMLLPRVRIRVLVIFILIGIWSIPATWVVGFWVLLDLAGFARETGTTAYAAHLGGYLTGLLGGLLVLLLGRTRGDDVDALWLFRQMRRRVAARAALAQPQTPPASTPVAKAAEDAGPPRTWLAEVEGAMTSGRTKGAMQKWERHAATCPEACLGAPVQLDLANHLQADGRFKAAADAYERFLKHHEDHPEAPQVRLLLGALLVRRLDRAADARDLLERALRELTSPDHQQLARELLQP